MSLLDAIRHRLKPLIRRADFDREMDEEFRHHQELHALEFAEGPDAAARARARFGSTAYYKEETRRMTALGWLDLLRQDLRYGVRHLVRAPAFTAVAVLSLAIGIGANSSIFSLIYSLLLNPLALPHPQQLVEVQHTGRDRPNDQFSYNDYQSLRRSSGFTSVTAFTGTGNVPIVAGTFSNAISVDAVDGNYFSTLGVRPLRGRLIGPEDERTHAAVVVISEQVWALVFNRSPSAVGSTITLHGTPFAIVGIVPNSYQGIMYMGSFMTAVPLSALPVIGGPSVETSDAAAPMLQIVGRIATAADRARVSTVVDAIYQSCCMERGTATGDRGHAQASGVTVASIGHGITSPKFDVRSQLTRLLYILMGGAAIVLLAACANIGTLLLARAAAREREVAVRRSLGASRGRLTMQMLVESSLLAVLGGAAGLITANWALRGLAAGMPGQIFDRVGLRFNPQILGFTAAASLASVLVFGVIPARRATRTDPVAPLREGSTRTARRGGWLDRSVVVAQLALALVLINGAGLFVATLRNLRTVNGGFSTEHVVNTEFDSRGTPYESSGLVRVADRLLARAERIPGVRSAALSEVPPAYGGRRYLSQISVQGYTPGPDENMNVWVDPVTPGFFSTVGTSRRMGRDFSPSDGATGQRVVIINEAFVHQYLRDRSALGTSIQVIDENRMMTGGTITEHTDTSIVQVVGVVGDARYIDVRQPPPPMMFVPMAQFEQIPIAGHLAVVTLTVRTTGDDSALPGAIRSAMLAEAPGVRIYGPETIETTLSGEFKQETLTAWLATLFGGVALTLAAMGLYGVVSYRVAQRTREIGVRMALGAASSSVVWMVLRQALLLVAIGVVVGAPLAFAGGRAIAAELYGVAGGNPLYVLGAGVLLLAVAVAAAAFPARRAANVDPLIALRAD